MMITTYHLLYYRRCEMRPEIGMSPGVSVVVGRYKGRGWVARGAAGWRTKWMPMRT